MKHGKQFIGEDIFFAFNGQKKKRLTMGKDKWAQGKEKNVFFFRICANVWKEGEYWNLMWVCECDILK